MPRDGAWAKCLSLKENRAKSRVYTECLNAWNASADQSGLSLRHVSRTDTSRCPIESGRLTQNGPGRAFNPIHTAPITALIGTLNALGR